MHVGDGIANALAKIGILCKCECFCGCVCVWVGMCGLVYLSEFVCPFECVRVPVCDFLVSLCLCVSV